MNPLEYFVPPFLTPELPGCGGAIKAEPEHFEVEEIPAYEPCGMGDHLFLWVEKRDVGADYFLRQVAKRLNVPPSEVGSAGLKDRRAVTRQYVSVPAFAEPNLAQLDGEGIRLVRSARHTNKLRPGHLKGNRFRVLIRGADPTKADSVTTILERIRREGMPNFYGPQRFGIEGKTVQLGADLLLNRAGRRPSPFLRKLALSAVQSLLFNTYLTERMKDNLLRTVLLGDVMAKWPTGGMFTVEDVVDEQRRFDARETVTAGPIFGRKTFPSHGPAAERETAVLTAAGLTSTSFDGFGKLLMGTRRHNLIYPDELHAEWEAEGLRLTFTLPSGCYATILLREVMKSEVSDTDPE